MSLDPTALEPIWCVWTGVWAVPRQFGFLEEHLQEHLLCKHPVKIHGMFVTTEGRPDLFFSVAKEDLICFCFQRSRHMNRARALNLSDYEKCYWPAMECLGLKTE